MKLNLRGTETVCKSAYGRCNFVSVLIWQLDTTPLIPSIFSIRFVDISFIDFKVDQNFFKILNECWE